MARIIIATVIAAFLTRCHGSTVAVPPFATVRYAPFYNFPSSAFAVRSIHAVAPAAAPLFPLPAFSPPPSLISPAHVARFAPAITAPAIPAAFAPAPPALPLVPRHVFPSPVRGNIPTYLPPAPVSVVAPAPVAVAASAPFPFTPTSINAPYYTGSIDFGLNQVLASPIPILRTFKFKPIVW